MRVNTIPPRPIDLAALIRAHPFITIEHPPELWQPVADDGTFIRFFGELIAASLARNGGVLSAVTVNISNVIVDSSAAGPIPQGEFVAITGVGQGDWGPEITRRPESGANPPVVSGDLEAAAAAAGAAWIYTRSPGDGRGSVTALFPRRVG